MTNMFIQKRLERLKENRLAGKPGLSIDQVRDTQMKLRFNKYESQFIELVSKQLDHPKALISNVLLIEAIIELVATDKDLCEQVMAEWYAQSKPSLDFFSEIRIRARRLEDPIEAEFSEVSSSVSQALEHK
ncbi:hypothetical protein K6Q96_06690 [Grimontia kaedaensis]|uniref:Uncharacterized protein n=1 Tax=Grimontia kaedaensis TaxID=2872157 RepID=A0ABY4WXF6_9GAMM|nr:hypothetical protein [Grimontia kaedaensis]USH03675.1 hypothetical protein K6Q96_06690 [Grimontia kaedaensis]